MRTVQVPTREWLAVLNTAIVEGWLEGVHSIKHPSNAEIRFPLWAGTFWTVLSKVIQEQRVWRHAEEWAYALPQGHRT